MWNVSRCVVNALVNTVMFDFACAAQFVGHPNEAAQDKYMTQSSRCFSLSGELYRRRHAFGILLSNSTRPVYWTLDFLYSTLNVRGSDWLNKSKV